MAEAASAGPLGVRLGGRNDYGSRVEYRTSLGGDARSPAVADIARAATLSRDVTIDGAEIGRAQAMQAGAAGSSRTGL